MNYDFHTIVIGGGSGGLVVASATANLGLNVALIEKDKMGGDCLNYGCIPSKSFLKAAHLAKDIKHASKYGLNVTYDRTNLNGVMDYVRSIIKEIEPHDSIERFEGLGVNVIKGEASFYDSNTVIVNNKKITAKYIVIATGSEPNIPDIKGVHDCDYLTNKSIFNLTTLPKHLIVCGGGPIGLELGQGFAHLGSRVTIIDHNDKLFNRDEPEVWNVMNDVLINDNIDLKLGYNILSFSNQNLEKIVTIKKGDKVEEIRGDEILLSLGRKPNTKSINLDKIGIKTDKLGSILIDSRCRTSKKHIFACGDVAGPFNFTHMAGYQAGIIIRNTIFKLPAKCNYTKVPWVTFTKPEVAHVGFTEEDAKNSPVKSTFNKSIYLNMASVDRAKCDDDRNGFIKLVLNKKKQIIGATIVGLNAGEMIMQASQAIQSKQSINSFLNLIYPYPIKSEIYKFAALDHIKDAFKSWMKKVIIKINTQF